MTTLMVLTVPLATIIIPLHILKESTMASDVNAEEKEDLENDNRIVQPEREIVNSGLIYINRSGDVIPSNNSNIYVRESYNFQCNGHDNTDESNNNGTSVAGNRYVPSPVVNGHGEQSAADPNGLDTPTNSYNNGTDCQLSSNTETTTRSLGWTVEKGGSSANVLNAEEEVKKFFPPPTTFDE